MTRKYISPLPLLVLLLSSPALLPISACIPTGGAIGSIYNGKLKLDSVYNAFKEMGLQAIILEEKVGGVKLNKLEVKLADIPDHKVLHGYVYEGKKKALVLAETDKKLSDSPLKLLEFLLTSANLTDPEKFSEPIKSYDNQIPPTALVKWLKEDRGVEIEQETLRCSSKGLSVYIERGGEVAVISNEIDRNLSFGVISASLSEAGLRAVWLDATDPKEAAKLLKYPAAIVLGGPLSPGSGYISSIFLPKSDIRTLLYRLKEGRTSGVIAQEELPGGRPLIIIAGVNRNDTRNTAMEFASSDLPHRIKEAIGKLPVPERSLFDVKISSSAATCGVAQGLKLTVGVGYNELLIIVREGAPDPCYRHKLQWYELDMDKRILSIALDLERTSQICVQCLAVVETKIRAGPLPEGEWTVIVNGVSKRIRIGS